MKRTLPFLILLLMCELLTAAGQRPAATPVMNGATQDADAQARVIPYSERTIARVRTQVRYTTLVVLPKSEKILDVTVGDKDFWVVEGTANFCYVKPAKVGVETNLNLVTESGRVYSFVLVEVGTSGALPDLKVLIEVHDETIGTAAAMASSQAADACQKQLEAAHQETEKAKADAARAVDDGVHHFLATAHFKYSFFHNELVDAIFHDGRFTYIVAHTQQAPVVYELTSHTKWGNPQYSLVTFTYSDGVFVVQKVLDEGYVVAGKKQVYFTREKE